MNDSLRYISKNPVYRRYHQGMITFSMIYAFHEHFVLVLSHDEVVHGKGSLIEKMPGDAWQKFANVQMFLAWMWHPGKKLIFQGIEFGQWAEWNHNQSLDWHLTQSPMYDGLRRLVQHPNWLYANEPAYYELDDTYEGLSGSISTTAITVSGPLCARAATRLLSSLSMPRRLYGEATGWESTLPASTRKS